MTFAARRWKLENCRTKSFGLFSQFRGAIISWFFSVAFPSRACALSFKKSIPILAFCGQLFGKIGTRGNSKNVVFPKLSFDHDCVLSRCGLSFGTDS